MKKQLLVGAIALSACSLVAIGFANNEPITIKKGSATAKPACQQQDASYRTPRNFHYDVGSQFSNTITREALLKAKSVDDLISKDAMYSITSMWNVELFFHLPGKDWIAKGDNNELTEGQLEIIQSMEYSSSFNIAGLCKRKHRESGAILEGYFDHYITVIPEKEANYEGGKDALKKYLVSQSSAFTEWLDPEQLRPGKIRFTVTKDGAVSDVTLEETCGYENVDQRLVEIVKSMPQKWTPAENTKGEKIDQKLVFSFGQVGC